MERGQQQFIAPAENVRNSDENSSTHHLSQPQVPFSLLSRQERYKQAIGEIGIAPADFFCMSEEELDWAYEGYLRRQELTANLFKLAVQQALAGNTDYIHVIPEKDYEVGTLEERQTTFTALGVLE